LRVLSMHLQQDGHAMIGASGGAEGLELARDMRPDLVLLDVRLPDMDGREVCRRIQEIVHVPVIFLSIMGNEADILYGFKVGADGYLVKPFSMAELRARIRAVVRRISPGADARAPIPYYDDGYP
jgi:DNA-binding response OmpR family regulator